VSGEPALSPPPSAAQLAASVEELAGLPAGSPEEQVALCLGEARVVASDFARLARSTPPALALRCETMAEQIGRAMRDFLAP
jgi:hypothetical protein